MNPPLELLDLPEELIETIATFLPSQEKLKLFEQNRELNRIVGQTKKIMSDMVVQFTYDEFYMNYNGPLQSLGFLNMDWDSLYDSRRKFQNLRLVGKKECLLPFVKIPLLQRFLEIFGEKIKFLGIYDIAIACDDLETILMMLPNLEELVFIDVFVNQSYIINPRFPKLKYLVIDTHYTSIFTFKNLLKKSDTLSRLIMKTNTHIPRKLIMDMCRQKQLEHIEIVADSVPYVFTKEVLREKIKFKLKTFKIEANSNEVLALLPFIRSQKNLVRLQIENPDPYDWLTENENFKLLSLVSDLKKLQHCTFPCDLRPTFNKDVCLPQMHALNFVLHADKINSIYDEFETLNQIMPNLKELEFDIIFSPDYINFRCLNVFENLEKITIHLDYSFILSQLNLPNLSILEADFSGMIPDAHLLTFLENHPQIRVLRFNGHFSLRVLDYIHDNMNLYDIDFGYDTQEGRQLCDELEAVILERGILKKPSLCEDVIG